MLSPEQLPPGEASLQMTPCSSGPIIKSDCGPPVKQQAFVDPQLPFISSTGHDVGRLQGMEMCAGAPPEC